MTLPLILMLVVGAVIVVVIAAVGLLTRGKKGLLDQEKFRTAWLKIENNLDKENVATYQFAILSADKLLDQALTKLDVAGETLDDKLKNAKDKIASVKAVCSAHKLRDKIVHETDAKIDPQTVRRALVVYKKVLRELGAI